jgi:HAMP domain-containing protein
MGPSQFASSANAMSVKDLPDPELNNQRIIEQLKKTINSMRTSLENAQAEHRSTIGTVRDTKDQEIRYLQTAVATIRQQLEDINAKRMTEVQELKNAHEAERKQLQQTIFELRARLENKG